MDANDYATAWARLDFETQDMLRHNPHRSFDLASIEPLLNTGIVPLASHTRWLSSEPPAEGWDLLPDFADWIDDQVADELEAQLASLASDEPGREQIEFQIQVRRNHV